MSNYSEEEFLSFLEEITAGNKSARPGDDCAVLNFFSPPLLMTTDSLVQRIHYDSHYTPREMGIKLTRINVSDIAAMGGQPRWATVNYCGQRPPKELKQLSRSLQKELSSYQTELIGGDLSRTPEPGAEVISLSLVGQGKEGKLMRRSNAHPGDLIAVTGRLGGAAAVIAQGDPANSEQKKLLYQFNVNPKSGQKIAESGCRCAIDLSDGLLKDLQRICRASEVGARVTIDRIPVHSRCRELAKSPEDALKLALTGGEDYTLLITFSEQIKTKIPDENLTIIGKITEKTGINFEPDLSFNPVKTKPGYDHFG